MPRQNDGTELFKRITKIELIRPLLNTGATIETTVAETIEEDETVLTLADATSFGGTPTVIIVGDGGVECNDITALATADATMRYKAEFPHSAGARCIKAEKVLLGEVETGGFTTNASQSTTDIESATSDVAIGTDTGTLSLDVAVGLLGHNIENELLWLGQAEKVRGTGTASDPWQGSVGGKGREIVGPIVIRASGVRRDGALFHYDCLNMTLAPSGSKSMGKGGNGNTSSYPIAGKITHRIFRLWKP